MAAVHDPFRGVRNLLGMLAVMLALAGQVAPAMVVTDADAARDAVLMRAAAVLCGDGAIPGSTTPQPHHHRHDAAVCPLCLASALPSPLLVGAPVLPAPMAMFLVRAGLPPPARAPPPRAPGAALPRGPPVLA